MGWYTVSLDCPRCGQIHIVIGGLWGRLQIQHGPDREGTIAELYVGQSLPEALVRLMNDKVWCDTDQDYILMDDPSRIILEPAPCLHEDPL